MIGRVSNPHIFDNKIWGYDEHGHGCAWSFDQLTLKEKEVVVYIVPYVGLPYTSLELAIEQARLTKNIVLRWNATTRTVEKVWDYLTDKKIDHA